MSAKAIFVGGTGSHSGKSWVTAALCRHLRRRGLRVAPFKAQNMSNNSAPAANGGEIGRAQAAQAEACEIEPHTDMNPILLKPVSDCRSQVIVHGRVWRECDAQEYYSHFDMLAADVWSAWTRLAARYDAIVIEGAGSVSEVNLREFDLVNLRFAAKAGAAGLLVADIDRGGVFASIAGTFCLLDDRERSVLRSFLINRFRGDRALLDVSVLEKRTGRKCMGVFPLAPDIHLDAEDAVGFESTGASNVAIIALPHISNLTDFRFLHDAARVTSPVRTLFDVVILPGTKNTISDLKWLRERGLDQWILRQSAAGARVIGICGGYQMLGESIEDPDSGSGERIPGLGLLSVRTIPGPEKIVRDVEAVSPAGRKFRAYEIHAGVTTPADPWVRKGNVTGTYYHGALEDPDVLEELTGIAVNATASKSAMYDRLADWFETSADLALFEELYL